MAFPMERSDTQRVAEPLSIKEVRALATRLFTPDRRALLLQALLRELSKAAEGTMPFRTLADRLASRHVHAEEERTLDERGWTPFDVALYRASNTGARAGWLHRRGGRWNITEQGRRALEEFPEAITLREAARKVLLGGEAIDEDGDGNLDQLPYLGEVRDWSREPPSVFRQGHATVGQLVSQIDHGTLGLPDIQRPFVWKNVKVRDLLDSMFRGFPIGYILMWDNPLMFGVNSATARPIGIDTKGTPIPKSLIIDGQQRLTSLYAVMQGRPVLDEHFRKRHIRIAFHPVEGRFEVADAATKRNPEWIPDVSTVFSQEARLFQTTSDYLNRLRITREVGPEHERAAEANIQRLVGLKNYSLGTLEIGADADEEQVAEIFVRVNSKGQNLKQADFILTLLSVFWEEGREQLEAFARDTNTPREPGSGPSPFNYLLHPGPDDLLRVVVAVSHRRARLRDTYQVLRGRDSATGRVTAEARDENLLLLKAAQARTLNVGRWHEFLKCLMEAGFRTPEMISSVNTTVYAYAFFLLGRDEYGVPLEDLRRLIARFYLMSTVTSRYIGSFESTMEEDLARLRKLEPGDASGFQSMVNEIMDSELTRDFWEVTLPARFESSSTRSLSPFLAAQCVLNATALFDTLSVKDLLDPSRRSTRKDLEIHHLFPKAWLRRNGVTEARQYNQIANLTPIPWDVNAAIADRAPAEYVPEFLARGRGADATTLLRHALPDRWWKLSYSEFLKSRRLLLAATVREAFERL